MFLPLTQTFVTFAISIVVTEGLSSNYNRWYNDSVKLRTIENKVIGGKPTTSEEFPHAVYVSMVKQRWFCGSSILSQWSLLTAAHCLEGIPNYKFQIDAFAGHENLHKVTIIRSVYRFVIHKNYHDKKDHNRYSFDIALLFLEDDMPLGKTLKRVIISSAYPQNVEKSAVAGWGNTNAVAKEQTIILRSVEQKIVDLKKCSSYRYWGPGLLCGGDSFANRPDRGDSGSGLLTDEHQQIGVVSFRINSMPEVVFYTNVTYHYGWIAREATKQCAENE